MTAPAGRLAGGPVTPIGAAVTTTSTTGCPWRSTTLTVSPAARQLPATNPTAHTHSNVIQVAKPHRPSANSVAVPRRAGRPAGWINLLYNMAWQLSVLSSFRSRILALVLGLVTLVLAATITAVVVKARAEVEKQVSQQLHAASSTAREALRFRGAQLANAAEVLTADFGFKEAVASADPPTLLSALENQRPRIGADLIIVLDPSGLSLSSTLGTLSDKTAQDLRKLVLDDPDWDTLRLYRLIDGRPYQLVLAPVLAPDLIGWAAIGFALDERVALDMSRLLGVDVSIVAGDPGETGYVASSLGQSQRTEFTTLAASPEATPFLIE